MHSFDSYFDTAILVLAEYDDTESSLTNLAQELVLFYAVLSIEALLTENFSMP